MVINPFCRIRSIAHSVNPKLQTMIKGLGGSGIGRDPYGNSIAVTIRSLNPSLWDLLSHSLFTRLISVNPSYNP